MPKRIFINAHCSFGDVFPALAIAKELHGLGHTVRMGVAADQVHFLEAHNIEPVTTLSSSAQIAQRLGLDAKKLAKKIANDSFFLIKHIAFHEIQPYWDTVRSEAHQADVVAGTSFAIGANLAAEKTKTAFAHLMLQPMMGLNPIDPPMTSAFGFLAAPPVVGLKKIWNETGLNVAKWAITASTGNEFNKIRAELGLSPQRCTPIFEKHIPPAITLGLFDASICSTSEGYEAPFEATGFPLFDNQENSKSLDADVQRILDGEVEPIVVSLGSFYTVNADAIHQRLIEISKTMGRPLIILSQHMAEKAQDDLVIRNFLPHSSIFPSAALIIHHAGIGSFSQALSAGRPQLALPFGNDQHDNARRMKRLGLGDWLDAKAASTKNLEQKIKFGLSDQKTKLRAQETAEKIKKHNAAAARRAADAILKHAP